MIIQFNPTKLCKQPFFMKIVNYLYLNQPVTLRAIKRQFPFQKNIDKLIEEFVKEGYIERFEKRYRLLISLVSDPSKIVLDQHFFINDDSKKNVDEFTKLGFKLKRIPSKIKHPIKNYKATYKYLKENNIEVVHCHMTLMNIFI